MIFKIWRSWKHACMKPKHYVKDDVLTFLYEPYDNKESSRLGAHIYFWILSVPKQNAEAVGPQVFLATIQFFSHMLFLPIKLWQSGHVLYWFFFLIWLILLLYFQKNKKGNTSLAKIWKAGNTICGYIF